MKLIIIISMGRGLNPEAPILAGAVPAVPIQSMEAAHCSQWLMNLKSEGD